MSRAIGFLFFLLFLAGFALVMLRDFGDSPPEKQEVALEKTGSTLVSAEWYALANNKDREQPAFVRFHADGKISGFGGCNSFFGSYTAIGGTLEIGPLGSTRKACAEPVMKAEAAFLQVIDAATAYRIDRDELALITPAGIHVELHLREHKFNSN